MFISALLIKYLEIINRLDAHQLMNIHWKYSIFIHWNTIQVFREMNMRTFKVSGWSYKQSYLECIAMLALGVEDRSGFTGDYSLQLLIVVYTPL